MGIIQAFSAVKFLNATKTFATKLFASPTANRTITLQDGDGTLAFLTDTTEWKDESDTAAYTSADNTACTFIFTIVGNKTAHYKKDTKVKFTQSQPLSMYFPYDNDANSVINGVNGTAVNVVYSPAYFGAGAVFNGTSSYISYAATNAWKPAYEFTVGCRFMSNTSGVVQGLVQSFSNALGAGGWILYIAANNRVTVACGNATSVSAYVPIVSSINVCDGQYHEVVFTYRYGYMQLYVDGTFQGATWLYPLVYKPLTYVRVGCVNNTGTNTLFLNGKIDDLFFINDYALDEETIRARYLANTAIGSGNITVTKYGIVSKPSTYSSPTTTVTVYCGNDYSVKNAIISNLKYSLLRMPSDFPNNPDKWTHYIKYFSNASRASPAVGVWYNLGGYNIAVPIGTWEVSYNLVFWFTGNTGGLFAVTLSKLNNQADFDTDYYSSVYYGAQPTALLSLHKSKIQSFNVKTTMSLLAISRDIVPTSIYFYADYPSGSTISQPVILKARYIL